MLRFETTTVVSKLLNHVSDLDGVLDSLPACRNNRQQVKEEVLTLVQQCSKCKKWLLKLDFEGSHQCSLCYSDMDTTS